MVTKTITEKTVIVCDICGKTIPYRTRALEENEKCMICGKDVCYRCKVTLQRKVKVRTYKHIPVALGCICSLCCKKKKINIDWDFVPHGRWY